jgi:hypothetical protein
MAISLSGGRSAFPTIFAIQMIRVEESTAQGTREPRAVVSDDDHADIRGLITAFHWYVAGLPRSNIGDHHADAHIPVSGIPPSVLAHCVSRVVGSIVMSVVGYADLLGAADFSATKCSGARRDLADDVPIRYSEQQWYHWRQLKLGGTQPYIFVLSEHLQDY